MSPAAFIKIPNIAKMLPALSVSLKGSKFTAFELFTLEKTPMIKPPTRDNNIAIDTINLPKMLL